MFEGGMRGAAFVSGAGLDASLAGTVSHELYSLVDWLPTIAGGIAGVDLALAALPKHPYQPSPPPLDGMNVWASLSTGTPSPRTSALLYLSPTGCFAGSPPVPCNVPGQGALRVGRYKVISGHAGEYMSTSTNVTSQFCGAQDGGVQPLTPPLPVTPATSPPFCPMGWVRYTADGCGAEVVPPPEEAGPGGACATTPCRLPSTSPLLTGGVMLFDVVGDPYETTDLAATMPELTAQLLAQLQAINATDIPQDHSARDAASDPARFGGVWTPWRGNPQPSACDPNTTTSVVKSSFDGASFEGGGGGGGGVPHLLGWCWSPSAGDGGRAPLNVSFEIDGVGVGGAVASVPRPPGFLNKTGAPNVQHGWDWAVPAPWAGQLARGAHTLRAFVLAPSGGWEEAVNSPRCLADGNPTRCTAPD